jgi:hypothetical protein
MARWRRLLVGGIGALSLLGAGTVSAGAHEGGTLVEFDSMTPVTGAALGPATDRGIPGGGAPWSIISGTGSVDRKGHVSVTVKGLIVVPLGKNPIGTFQAVVSCITKDGAVKNVETTGVFPASTAGDSTIDATVTLPHPCRHPEVFVGGSPRGSFIWFAKSNTEEDED